MPSHTIEIQDAMIGDLVWLVKVFYFGKKPRARKFTWILLPHLTKRFPTEADALEYARGLAKAHGWQNYQPQKQIKEQQHGRP